MSSHRESGVRYFSFVFRLHARWIRIAALSRISASGWFSPSRVSWRRFKCAMIFCSVAGAMELADRAIASDRFDGDLMG